jgi:hypothetical protein
MKVFWRLFSLALPVVIFSVFISLPALIFAVSGGSSGGPCSTGSGGLPNPLGGTCTIPQLLEKIVRFMRDIASPIVAGMVIYGAFQIMTAGGDPEKLNRGKKTILWAVIGYAIIWIGWGIASIIQSVIG